VTELLRNRGERRIAAQYFRGVAPVLNEGESGREAGARFSFDLLRLVANTVFAGRESNPAECRLPGLAKSARPGAPIAGVLNPNLFAGLETVEIRRVPR
jgi:hypothetical protein